jgi:hypothetical protein
MSQSPDPPDPPTQKTQPAKGKPIDIPVPKREDIERLLTKATKGSIKLGRAEQHPAGAPRKRV